MKYLILVYLFTYGGAAVSLVRPYIGLLIYIAFAILKPEGLWSYAVPIGNYSRIIGFALLLGWLVQGGGNWRFGRGTPIVVALWGYFLWSMLSAMQAPNQGVAWQFVEHLAKIVLPFVAGLTLIDSVAKLKQLAWTIVLSTGYVAYAEHEHYYTWGIHTTDNLMAHSMVVGAGVAFFLAAQAKPWWQKGLAYLAMLLMTHTVFFHMSRGAMLGLIAVGVFSFLVMEKKPAHYLAFAVALLIVVRLAGTEVQARFATVFASDETRDASAQSRLDLWRDMWSVARANPVFGVGPHHWHLIAHEFGWPHGKDGHGLWPQLSAEIGLPGVGFLLGFYFTSLLRLFPLAVRKKDSEDNCYREFACMVVASMVGFLAEAMFGSFKSLETPYYVGLLGAGTLKVYSQLYDVRLPFVLGAPPAYAALPAPSVVQAPPVLSPPSVGSLSR